MKDFCKKQMDCKDICRICLRSDEWPRNLLFKMLRTGSNMNSKGTRKLFGIFCEILETDTSGGHQVDQICENCSKELHQIYLFIRKCEKSTQILNSLKSVKIRSKKFNDVNIKVKNYEETKSHQTIDVLDQSVKVKLEKGNPGNPNNITDYGPGTSVSRKDDEVGVKEVTEIYQTVIYLDQPIKVKLEKEDPGGNAYNIMESNTFSSDSRIDTEVVKEETEFHQTFMDRFGQEDTDNPNSNADSNDDALNSRIDDEIDVQEEANKKVGIKQDSEICFEVGNIEKAETSVSTEEAINRGKLKIKIVRRKSATQQDAYNCDRCGKKYIKLKSLIEHLQRVHDIETSQIEHLKHQLPDQNQIRVFACDLCNATYNRKDTLMRHKRKHTDAKFECFECGSKFLYMESLHKHMQNHPGQTFDCDQCDSKYTELQDLQAHRRLHSGEIQFTCDQCDKSFNRKLLLRRHKRTFHQGQRFACDLCGKMYMDKTTLTVHKLSHSDEASYACDRCRLKFDCSKKLEIHKKVFHECLFECGHCNLEFTFFAGFRLHQNRTHPGRNYKCPECDGEFLNSGTFLRHWQKHVEAENDCEVVQIE